MQPATIQGMKLSYAGQTDVGRKRTHNEDNFFVYPELSLFVVCDGMGGHASGEVASQIAVETIREFYTETAQDPEKTWPFKEDPRKDYPINRLVTAIRLANFRVHDQSNSDPAFKGMGTTCVGMVFEDDRMLVAHVGDSRCYRVRGDAIDQITEDHSLLNDYKKMAKLTPEEEENFPHKNIIVRALGMKADVLVDAAEHMLRSGDIFLSCSDGLSGEITDDEMLRIVRAHKDDLDRCAAELIRAANENGGKDNITVALVRID